MVIYLPCTFALGVLGRPHAYPPVAVFRDEAPGFTLSKDTQEDASQRPQPHGAVGACRQHEHAPIHLSKRSRRNKSVLSAGWKVTPVVRQGSAPPRGGGGRGRAIKGVMLEQNGHRWSFWGLSMPVGGVVILYTSV